MLSGMITIAAGLILDEISGLIVCIGIFLVQVYGFTYPAALWSKDPPGFQIPLGGVVELLNNFTQTISRWLPASRVSPGLLDTSHLFL